MLDVKNLSVVYGKHQALTDISISVDTGELVVILGANGAGKSSLLRALAGLCEGEMSGQVSLDSKLIFDLNADEIVQLGIALVPEGRAIFGDLSVEENLKLGAYAERARSKQQENLALVFQLFPKLQERRKQVARTMSGGEQQMVAIGRALMSAPSILMLDEPSLGLSPLLSKELFQVLSRIRESGIGVLMVEQNAKLSLSVADRGYLIEVGNLVGEDTAENLSRDPAVQAAYLGSGSKTTTPKPAIGIARTAASNSLAHRYIQPAGLDQQSVAVPFAGVDAMGDLLRRAAESGQDRPKVQVPLVAGRSEGRVTDRTLTPRPSLPEGEGVTSRATTLSPLPTDVPVRNGASGRGAGVRGLDVSGDLPPRTINLLQPKTDDRITELLQEFEDAAAAARLPQQNASNFTTSTSTVSSFGDGYEDEPLPTIPVFRKSDIQVFKRDTHGVLKRADAKQSKGH